MTVNTRIVLLAAGLMPLLLFYEKKEDRKGLLPAKTALSMLFIVAIAVQPHSNREFYYWLLGGLSLCLFMQREMLNRTIGLPLYYAGQFLLAFSVGVVR